MRDRLTLPHMEKDKQELQKCARTIFLLLLMLAIAGCAKERFTLRPTNARPKINNQKHLMALASRFPVVVLKDHIPINEVWTDYTDKRGGYLKTWEYVEPKNDTSPFLRVYVNALVFIEGDQPSDYAKFHVIVEKWKFDPAHKCFIIHYWAVMNPVETAPYIEFRLIHKQQGRILLDQRHGFYAENRHQLVADIRRVMHRLIVKKRQQTKQMPPGD